MTNAIEIKESKTTVHDGKEPVYWLLLTTHEVVTLEDAKKIVGWYCQRWHIEQVFRTLKSQGLMIESSPVEDVDAKIKLTLLAVEAAIQIMQLTLTRKENNTRPALDTFNEDEIKCLADLQKKLEGKKIILNQEAFYGHHGALLDWVAGKATSQNPQQVKSLCQEVYINSSPYSKVGVFIKCA